MLPTKRIPGNKKIYDSILESQAYDVTFYENSRKDFYKALPVLKQWFLDFFQNEKSIIDLGCGSGEMISCIKNNFDTFGVDFSIGAKTLGPTFLGENFIVGDLTKPLKEQNVRLNREFDIVLSLETYEHIHSQFEDVYLNNIRSFNPKWIILSCALPDQKGRHHYNKLPFKTFLEKTKIKFPDFTGDFCSTIAFHSLPHLRYFYRYNTIVLKRNVYV